MNECMHVYVYVSYVYLYVLDYVCMYVCMPVCMYYVCKRVGLCFYTTGRVCMVDLRKYNNSAKHRIAVLKFVAV